VPSGLDLPAVDVDETFGARTVAEAERFERFLRWTWVLAQVALLVTLWIYAKRGAVLARESAAGRIGTGMLLGMLGLGIAWLVGLPFAVVDHWWYRRHGLTDMSYVEAVFTGWLQLIAIFLSISLALVIVMALAGPLGDRWWIPGSLVFVALGVLFAYVAPFLTPGTEPLRDRTLVTAAREYEREQGLGEIPLRVEEVSEQTDLANAYAVGVANTRRVVLWDTLLRDFDEREVKVVLAHELGHHSSEHIPKGLALYGLLAIPGAWIVARITRRRGGMRAPEAVPLGLLVVVVLGLLATPLENWVSRRYEAEADWKALASTEDPAAAATLMRGFAESSLGDPSPPWWAHVLLDSHPSLEQRVRMARAWAARNPGAEPPPPG
jgi:STE24 endopeptidase